MPGPYTANWLTRQNHEENKNEKTAGLQISINIIDVTIDIPTCMMRSKSGRLWLHYFWMANEQTRCKKSYTTLMDI